MYKVGTKLLKDGRAFVITRCDDDEGYVRYMLHDCETGERVWQYKSTLDNVYTLAPEPKEEGMKYKVGMELRHNASGSMRRITGICRGLAGELYYLLDEDERNTYSADELDKYYTVIEPVEPCLVHLMSCDEIERRLNDGEDPVALSIEHWVQNAAYIAAGGKLPYWACHDRACPLCRMFSAVSRCPSIKTQCADCPLSIGGGRCEEAGSTWNKFRHNPSYENAMAMISALIRCRGQAKQGTPEPELPQFYVWEEGKEPVGKVGLRLVTNATGEIMLIAVDEGGRRLTCGRILAITRDGRLFQFGSVDPDLGFQCDRNRNVLFVPTSATLER